MIPERLVEEDRSDKNHEQRHQRDVEDQCPPEPRIVNKRTGELDDGARRRHALAHMVPRQPGSGNPT